MGAPLALLVCSIGVAGLFYLNRDKSDRNSESPLAARHLALDSRVETGLGMVGDRRRGRGQSRLNTRRESNGRGCFWDTCRLLESESCSAGRVRRRALLAVSGPIVIYFLYCLMSVAWSPIPGPAFKRWTKAIGDLVMVLIVVTDGQPDCGSPATLFPGRLCFIAIFHRIDSVHRSGPWIYS